MLKFAGAVRLSQIVEGVTHVLAAEKEKTPPSLCPVVDLRWLVKSMQTGRPAPEEEDEDGDRSRGERQTESMIESCTDEGDFEEKLLAQYASMGVAHNQSNFW